MVHVEVDTSPISVQTESVNHTHNPTLYKTVVYLYDEAIWSSEPVIFWSTLDEDDVKLEWDHYYQQFIREVFTEWLKTNGPGAQAEERASED